MTAPASAPDTYPCGYCDGPTPAHRGLYVMTVERTSLGLPIAQWVCRDCADLLALEPAPTP